MSALGTARDHVFPKPPSSRVHAPWAGLCPAPDWAARGLYPSGYDRRHGFCPLGTGDLALLGLGSPRCAPRSYGVDPVCDLKDHGGHPFARGKMCGRKCARRHPGSPPYLGVALWDPRSLGRHRALSGVDDVRPSPPRLAGVRRTATGGPTGVRDRAFAISDCRVAF